MHAADKKAVDGPSKLVMGHHVAIFNLRDTCDAARPFNV